MDAENNMTVNVTLNLEFDTSDLKLSSTHTSFESAIIMRAQAAVLHWEQTTLLQAENKKRNISNLRIEYERDAIDVGHSLSQQQRYVSGKTITNKKGGKRWHGALTLLRRIWLEERAAGLGIEMLLNNLARKDW